MLEIWAQALNIGLSEELPKEAKVDSHNNASQLKQRIIPIIHFFIYAERPCLDLGKLKKKEFRAMLQGILENIAHSLIVQRLS